MQPLSFSGLSSGVDWPAVVDEIIKYEARPSQRITTRMEQVKAANTAWRQVQDLMGRLRTHNNAFRFGNTFDAMGATVGQTSAGLQPFSARATEDALQGAYTVRVLALAQAETMASASQASSTTDLGVAGTFEINGVEIEVTAADSLNTIRDAINAASAGVRASVLMVRPGEYQLAIKANQTGEQGIGLVDGPESVAAALGLNSVVAGTNSRIEVDGLVFERAGNSISDLIEGVTLTLHQANLGESVELAVAPDADLMAERVKAWVDAFNDIRNFLARQRRADGTRKPPLYDQGALTRTGEGMLRGALGDGMWEYGVSVARDGTLSFNAATFKEKFNQEPAATRAHFTDRATAMEGALTSFGIGADSIAGNVQSSNDLMLKSLQTQEDRWVARLNNRRASLMKQFSRVESMISSMNDQMGSIAAFSSQMMNNTKK
jgi:flagellar hook-associated protein 2